VDVGLLYLIDAVKGKKISIFLQIGTFKRDDLCDYFLQDKGDPPQFNGEEEKGNIRRAASTPIIKDGDSKSAKGRKLLVYIYSVSIFYMTATNLGLYYGTKLSSSDDNLRIVFLII
jgi:hypothetical protein